MVYRQTVRNVTTYGGAAETVWAAMDIGYEVYYDNSATMPAGTYLSLAAADAATGANPKFGHIMPLTEADRALYPKGGITASTAAGLLGVGVVSSKRSYGISQCRTAPSLEPSYPLFTASGIVHFLHSSLGACTTLHYARGLGASGTSTLRVQRAISFR